ncbi:MULTISPECIES: ATP-binding protein [unclassified Microbacterium]|uniref:ATP-binding protein n=1 Tax=unclassified Microbacterium TaxID=2609290 RepID=UPI00214C3C9A|nr:MULTISPECIES: ATP-binding protein [unclassified Microbacterium]MCR2785830.1 ATP-binding protein [Microbacterium sp. zg.B96]WIM17191.1 MFS domain-containing histidine kinase [Microbacterium sp. zg-B96]
MQSLPSPTRGVRTRSTRWPRLDAAFADRAEMRSAALSQLVLAGVVLVLTFLMFHHGFTGNVPLFFAGVVIVFVLTAVAIAAPWSRVPLAWTAVVPVGDIIAISLMRFADPAAGTGMLFAFPVLWLSASFGLAGFAGGVSMAVVGFSASVAVEPRQFTNFGVFLLPVMLIAIGATAYTGARRAAAQRRLLRRQAEILAQALERSRHQEQLLSEVLDTADLGVLHIEHGGAISILNDGEGHLQHLLTDPDGAAPTAYERDGRTRISADQLPLARALRGEEFDDERVWIEPVAGERRALSVTVHRLANTDSESHAGAVVVCREVTAEMSALQARDLLVSSVSHELRTPLTSIIGHIELALDSPGLPPSAASSLAIADRNADRLLALVGDVLAASSHAATLPMTPEDVDVLEIVKASAQSIVTGDGSRNVTIDLSRAMPARGYVDPLRLRQVVDNLLSNAIKYNREGGRVSLMTATRGRKTLILVEDTGVGLDEEDLVNVFQRYYRGAAVRRAGVEGSGLGLSISRDIVRRLGGDIYVNSTLGVGSTFTVSIPAVRPGVATQTAADAARGTGALT